MVGSASRPPIATAPQRGISPSTIGKHPTMRDISQQQISPLFLAFRVPFCRPITGCSQSEHTRILAV